MAERLPQFLLEESQDAYELVLQLWDEQNELPFPQWEAKVRELIARHDPKIDANLFHTGANLFSHPDSTPEFARDIGLIMARHPDYEVRARLNKHLTQGTFRIPDAYLSEIQEAIKNGPDQEVRDLGHGYHDRIGQTLSMAA